MKKPKDLNYFLKEWFHRGDPSSKALNDLTDNFSKIRNRLLLPKFLRHMKKLGIGGLSAGNNLMHMVEGDQCFHEFLKAIKSAKRSINLETYIFADDDLAWEVARLLADKAKVGVEVNIIYDAVGSLIFSKEVFTLLKESGAEIIEYHPLMPWRRHWNLQVRDHRKILVVDGSIAFVGGINISRDYAGAQFKGSGWRDSHLKIEGPAVRDVQFSFLETWYRNGGAIIDQSNHFPPLESIGNKIVMIVGSASRKKVKPIKESYLSAIESARHSIYITNAYFIPTFSILQALIKAAHRGVDVRLLLPYKSDVKIVQYASRYLFKRYLKSDIRLFEYEASMLHAKTAVIDGFWSTIGSSNLDGISFKRNLEINAVVLDQEFGEAMENQFLQDCTKSRELQLEHWQRRSVWHFLVEWFFYRFRNYL